jgi:outer membrane biosynthesis protein TonB
MNHKLKYYCRGLGTGILVTAIVLIARPTNGQESLTNEEIIARAEALGMKRIESLTDLPQPTRETVPSEEETAPSETTPSEDETITETAETTENKETAETTQETETDATETETSEAETETSATETSNSETKPSSSDTSSSTTESTSDTKTATITISRGNGSLTVSRALETVGLIDDAKAYDQYLCAEGYDNALRVGVYHIPLGSTYEQIAKIITGKNS